MPISPRKIDDKQYFTAKQRHRIIKDIAHWKAELEMNSEFTDDDFQDYLDTLRGLDDPELVQWWYDHVGEWIASRGDLPVPALVDFDTYLDVQFGKLLAGHETDYGWVVSVHVPQKAPSSRKKRGTASDSHSR